MTVLGNIYAAEVIFRARADPFGVAAESIAQGSTMNLDPENIGGSYYGWAYEGR